VIAAASLIASLLLASPEPMTPTLSADLDGDGAAETVKAAAGRGAVKLTVERAAAKGRVSASAPAPSSDVVRVSLTAASIGSAGSLLEVLASTDASECLSVWRFHDGALTRLPIRGNGGRALPDCAPAGQWTHRWEREGPDAPSALVRERTEKTERGTLRRRETYAFAGFSLDLDWKRTTTDIQGLTIPGWYDARFYTHEGLERLYSRFDLPSFRATPRLTLVTDRERGAFALRFETRAGEILAPVESFALVEPEKTATLVARVGEKTVRAVVRLGGDGNVPVEIRIDGLDPALDTLYGPAGAWHGRAREIYPSAGDELASQHLTGTWRTPQGAVVQIQTDGVPPYRLRVDRGLFGLDFDTPAKTADVTLVPTDGSRRGWALVLAGPNALDRFPVTCDPGPPGTACQADGSPERLRRMGARINVN
jgi:hypothetical protein